MSVREYIGARYVPLFADPIEWDNTKTYEPLTIVYYQGNSYTSRQAVPTGIAITNETYWALTGNYNAQIEAYRQEVTEMSDRVTANATAISNESTARAAEDDDLQDAIDAEESARIAADNALDARIDALNESPILLIFGDSWSDLEQGFPDWVTPITDELDFEVKRYADGGGGWLNGTRISTQITTALADLSESEIARVSHIVIIAGVNDIRNYTDNFVDRCDAIYAEISQCVQTLRTNFNAKIYIGCNTVGGGYATNATGFEKCIALGKYIQARSMAQNIPYMNNIHYIFCPWNDSIVFNEDCLHLSTAGARVLGNSVLNCIKGIGIDVTREAVYENFSMNGYTANFFLKFSNGKYLIGGRFTANATISANTNTDFSGNIGNTFSKVLRASFLSEDNSSLPNVLSPTLIGAGTLIGYLQPRSGGTLRLHNTTELSEGTAIFGELSI